MEFSKLKGMMTKAKDPAQPSMDAATDAKKKLKTPGGNGNTASPTKTNTETGGSSPGGASTGGVGSGIGGAGTGGAATGGASTGGAGTVNVTISGNSGTGSNSGGKGGKGKDKKPAHVINISGVGGTTKAGSTASGDGPGSSGSGGKASGHGGGGGGAAPDEPQDYTSGSKNFSKGGFIDMPNSSSLVDKLMKKRKMARGGDVPEDDFNTDPDLREDSSELSNSSDFDDLLSPEQDSEDTNEALYADGGEVDSDEDVSNAHVSNQDIQSQSPPPPSLAPAVRHFGKPKQDNMRKSYDKGRMANYADGGEVGSRSRLHQEKIDYNKDLREPIQEDVDHDYDEHTTYAAEGFPAPSPSPMPIDPDKAQSAQDSMRKAFKYKSGGKVSPHSDNSPSKELDGSHSTEGDPLPMSDKFYDPKKIKNRGRQEVDLNMYANGGMAKMAYGQGRKEYDEGEQPLLNDENSDIAFAEGGIAYNPNLKEEYPNDSDLVTDERSSLVFAEGGDVAYTDTDEHDQDDRKQGHDEDSEIAYADGGSVEHAARLEADDEDTREDKDESSSIVMARGGQIANDQAPGMNPKSMQNEDSQDKQMKLRRRKQMLSALND